MAQQRNAKLNKTPKYHNQLLHAIRRHLPKRGLPLMPGDNQLRWTDRLLVIAAILMAWSDAALAIDAFRNAREVVISMYRTRRRPGNTLGGFLGRLRSRTAKLLSVLVPSLRIASEKAAGKLWRYKNRYVVMAVDGSKSNCPRTKSNLDAFGTGTKAKAGAMQLLTTLYHVQTGLLWAWRRGRGDASERGQLREMIAELPKGTLLLGDAGFTGYDLMRSLLNQNVDFLIRAGANVTLLQKLGFYTREYDGIVYLWPKEFSKQKFNPIILRLIHVTDGSRSQWLLTNVMNMRHLSNNQAAELYCLRWKIEVSFRSLKQTMSHRKMLSASAGNAAVELDWAMIGFWLLALMAVDEMSTKNKGCVSIAKALREVRFWMRQQTGRPPTGGIRRKLKQALIDDYERQGLKKAHNWPHKKSQKPPGRPNLRMPTESELMLAKVLKTGNIAA